AHAHALMILRARGELSQQQLGAELGIDKSNVARLCAKMVEVGHAVQRVGEHDARSRLVSLTARGSRVADGVDASSRARFLAILQQIAPERREAVLEALADLVSAVRALSVARAEEEAA